VELAHRLPELHPFPLRALRALGQAIWKVREDHTYRLPQIGRADGEPEIPEGIEVIRRLPQSFPTDIVSRDDLALRAQTLGETHVRFGMSYVEPKRFLELLDRRGMVSASLEHPALLVGTESLPSIPPGESCESSAGLTFRLRSRRDSRKVLVDSGVGWSREHEAEPIDKTA
jgi:hypothetical protein